MSAKFSLQWNYTHSSMHSPTIYTGAISECKLNYSQTCQVSAELSQTIMNADYSCTKTNYNCIENCCIFT